MRVDSRNREYKPPLQAQGAVQVELFLNETAVAPQVGPDIRDEAMKVLKVLAESSLIVPNEERALLRCQKILEKPCRSSNQELRCV